MSEEEDTTLEDWIDALVYAFDLEDEDVIIVDGEEYPPPGDDND